MQTSTMDTIELHIRTYRSLLKSAGEIKISQLSDPHIGMQSILHEKGNSPDIDIAAFIYVLLRLPANMSGVQTVILGQSYSVFKSNGFPGIRRWREVEAPGRRRKMFFDGKKTLGVYITSVTDVDDIITLLTAFQIEWNKFHGHLEHAKDVVAAAEELLGSEDAGKIKKIWGDDYRKFLYAIKKRSVDFNLKLLSGSYTEYSKATNQWWHHIVSSLKHLHLEKRPVYFTSSNMHSLANIASRFAIEKEPELLAFIKSPKNEHLAALWEDIEAGRSPANREFFLYYIAKKYAKAHPKFIAEKEHAEKSAGIHTVSARHFLDIDAQIFELSKLAGKNLGQDLPTSHLKNSNAVIVNIDYPLGWAAYLVLTELGRSIDILRGIYIMGKAATLNGQVGDILLPGTVYDLHTKNLYIINNAIVPKDFTGVFATGLILENQKTVTVKGTFFENRSIIEGWYRDGYTTIEMEAGPYLNAAYEFVYYNRYEEDQFINLVTTPFEIGIAHYASDTPYSKAANLGVRNLSYEGVEPTYAISKVILSKILEREKLYVR